MNRLGETLDVASQPQQTIIEQPCMKRRKSRLGRGNNLSLGPGFQGVRDHAEPTDTLMSPDLGLPMTKLGSLARKL